MGWNYRKRIKVAPGVRLNISRRGISSTIGVRGASMAFEKNGTYVNTGIPGTGFYQRKKISGTQSSPKNQPINIDAKTDAKLETSSGCLLALMFGLPVLLMPILYALDEDKGMFWFLTAFFSVCYLFVFLAWILKFFLPKKDHLLEHAVRSLKTASGEEQRILQNFVDCYKLINEIDTLKQEITEIQQRAEKRKSAKLDSLRLDKEQKLSLLEVQLGEKQYDVDKFLSEPEKERFAALCTSFEELMNVEKIWYIVDRLGVDQVKSSANYSIARKDASVYVGIFNFLKSKYDIPVFDTGDVKYYLYPKFLIEAKSSFDFKVFPYSQTTIRHEFVSFCEIDSAPRDAEYMYQTWEYVNKDGNPDKRFANNRKLSVYKYGYITLTLDPRNVSFMISNGALGYEFENRFRSYLSAGMSELSKDNQVMSNEIIVNSDRILRAGRKFYDHLKKMGTNETVLAVLESKREMLQFVESIPFKINSRVAFIGLMDMIQSYKKMGYSLDLEDKEGYGLAIFLILLAHEDSDITINIQESISRENLRLFSKTIKQIDEGFSALYMQDDRLLMLDILEGEGADNSLTDQYAILFYRFLSVLSKVDGNVSEVESLWLSKIMDFLSWQEDKTSYDPDPSLDPKFFEVARFIAHNDVVKISSLQENCNIGYSRAKKILEQLEQKGIVAPQENGGPFWKVLLKDPSILKASISFKSNDRNAMTDKLDTDLSKVKMELSEKRRPIEQLNDLVGLDAVKSEVLKLTNYIQIQKMRHDKGLSTRDLSYHCVFVGNPGTGKTTVARILSEIYRDLGVLKKGHLIETDRSGLVAEYVGQTAIKTNKIIDSALDGVLFIDEAYSLSQGGNNDYGKEAIATLIKRMEDDRDRLVVILAGYGNEMKSFMDANPGLRSRFNRYIDFPDYSAEDLMQIFDYYIAKYDYILEKNARERLMNHFKEAVKSKDTGLGNARYVRNVSEKVLESQAMRLASVGLITEESLRILTEEDIPHFVKQSLLS